MPGSWRCKYHGGRRIGRYRGGWPASAHRSREVRQALYRALGLPWLGGAPRKIEKVRTMADEAKAAIGQAVMELEAVLPPDIMKGPIEKLRPAEALARVSLSGLYQLGRIVEQKIRAKDLKQQRLIGDMALGANKLLKSHAEGERNHDLIGRLLAALEAEKAPAEEK